MRVKSALGAVVRNITDLPKEDTIPVVVTLCLIVIYCLIFFIDKPVTFSYAGKTCVRQLTLLPTLHKSTSGAYVAYPAEPLTVGGVPLAATTMCFIPTIPPHQGTEKVGVAPFGMAVFQKVFTLAADAPPLANAAILDKPVPVSKPLKVPLSATDKVFKYLLRINDKQIVCQPKDKAASCDLTPLKLSQGVTYTTELSRQFGSHTAAAIIKKEITTLPAVRVADSSVKTNETVYAKPKSFEVTFDKKIVAATAVLSRLDNGKRITVPVSSEVRDTKLYITTPDDLPRLANYELSLPKVEAEDGSGLEEAYVLPFKMSGGPKVTSINIGKTGVALGATAIITFDQPLSDKQDIAKAISATGGATIVGRKGTQVSVSLAGVPKCGDFSIKINDELESSYDIKGGSAWSYSGRVICHSVGTVGYSNRGRPITAYYFGSGPSTVLYTGAIHGNEVSTKFLMDRWVDELEANARAIPAGKSVVVVPQINPDGVAANTRVNARNVDINRNFATSDWKKDITTVNNQPFPGGGGETAMSEPETQALASLAGRLRPSLVLSYHSVGSVVAANQAGNSVVAAGLYSQLSGYQNTTGQTSTTFEYSISGTADDWYAEKLGISSVLVELGSSSNPQFSRNQKAMWAMLNV